MKLSGATRIPICLALGFAAIAPGAAFAQTESDPPAFEVASIKLSDPFSGHLGVLTYPGGRVNFGHQTLADLIDDALELQTFQVSGGLGWARSEMYDIDARVPASSESSKANPAYRNSGMNAEQRRMLLTLLADRFQLKFHRETIQGPVYRLENGGGKLRLEEAKDKNAFAWIGSATAGGMMTGTGIQGINASMALLAERLMWYFERPVLDETGLKGSFDFRYEVPLDGPPITDSRLMRSPEVLSSIITSLQGIGLKLAAGKGPIETIVVDHAEKPSAN